jgi:hypothetical protein
MMRSGAPLEAVKARLEDIQCTPDRAGVNSSLLRDLIPNLGESLLEARDTARAEILTDR